MNSSMARFIIKTKYPKHISYPPCHLDICICMVNLNLNSYNDLHKYKTCYNKNNLYSSYRKNILNEKMYGSFEHSFDEVV